MNYQLLVNPSSGRGKGAKLGPKIADYLSQNGANANLQFTTSVAELQTLAIQAYQQPDTVLIIAGGDGTISLVINAIFAECSLQEIAQKPVGIIPVGTGNDFIKAADIPLTWQAACDVILAGHQSAIDIGRLELQQTFPDSAQLSQPTSYFINSIASGFDAQVGISANNIPLLRGQIVYVLALLYHLIKGSKQNLATLRFINTQQPMPDYKGPLALAATSNGVCYGGAFHIAPDASLDDGLFDIVIGEWHGRLATLKIILSLLKGKHMQSKHVHGWQCQGINISTENPIPIASDGELVHEAVTEYQITVLPKALPLYQPKSR